MPEGRFASVVILAEDWAQERFMKGWVRKHINVDRRGITSPARSTGAGEQFVRDQFKKELANHRARAGRLGVLLLTIIDADTGTCDTRYQQLLDGESLPPRVFIFIPKRNIETWVHYFGGGDCDEEQCYKYKYPRDPAKLGPQLDLAAEEFLSLVQNNGTAELPSIQAGIVMARRIPRDHVPHAGKKPG